MDRFEIVEIQGTKNLPQCAEVIRDSFATVAAEFHLTAENCPTHPSMISAEALAEMEQRGVRMFGRFVEDRMAGFVALEILTEGECSIEKLAVLPKFRHRGFGGSLLCHALSEAKRSGGKTVSIAIIDAHAVLKRWYEGYGFEPTETKQFAHLPFAVCFMQNRIDRSDHS